MRTRRQPRVPDEMRRRCANPSRSPIPTTPWADEFMKPTRHDYPGVPMEGVSSHRAHRWFLVLVVVGFAAAQGIGAAVTGAGLAAEGWVQSLAEDNRSPIGVEPLNGSFTPPHSDAGFDANGNGLYDFLIVNVSFMVDRPENYTVVGFLHDANFTLTLFEETSQFLEAGSWVVFLIYPGFAIHSSGVDGPYAVDLTLFDGNFTPLDTDTHLTAAYNYTEFDPPPVEFAPPHSDVGVDTDGDGRFNVLSVQANLTVMTGGAYGLIALLHDANHTVNLLSDTLHSLEPGSATVPIPFSGSALNGSGVDGPYLVDMAVYDPVTLTWIDVDQHATKPYDHLDFEEPPSIHSGYTTTSPTIDGALGADEWTNATVENLTAILGNQVPALLLVMNDNEFLYIAYDAVGDTTQDSLDVAAVAFDTGNDNTATRDHEDEFVQGGWADNNQAHFAHNFGNNWTVRDSPFQPPLAGAWGFGASPASSADHRIYEFKIPLALLNATAGDTLGLFGGSHLAPGLADFTARGWSTWPDWVPGPIPLSGYGDLILAESGDTAPPTISITSPSQGAVVIAPSVTVEWEASDADSGIDRFEVSVDEGEPQVLPAAARSHPVPGLSDGLHEVTVTAVDVAGNVQLASVSFVVDTLAPTLQLTAPAAGLAIKSTTVLVTWTATDAGTGISRYEIVLDGGDPRTLPSSDTSDSLTDLSEGPHTVEVTAFDGAGRSTTASREFLVDVTAPEVSIVSPSGDYLGSSTIEVQWSSGDSGSGLVSIEVKLDDQEPVRLPTTQTSYPLTGVTDGPHTIRVTVTDAAGNSATTARSVTIDTADPTIAIDSPTGDSLMTSSDVSISFTRDDLASGIDRIELRVDGGAAVALSSGATSHVVRGLSDGSHEVTITVYDRAGNSATDSVTFRVDTGFLSPSGPYGYGGLGLTAAVLVGAIVAAAAVVRSRRRARPPRAL